MPMSQNSPAHGATGAPTPARRCQSRAAKPLLPLLPLAMLLAACSTPPVPEQAGAVAPAAWQAPRPAVESPAVPPWLQAADPVLGALLEAVQARSPSLQQAVARRDEVRALAGLSPGGPRVQGLVQVQRTQPVQPAGSTPLTQALGQFDASWEVDLFA